MKKLIASFALQLLALAGSAYPASSILNVRLQSNRPFVVQIDNQHFNVPDVDYSIHDLAPGTHYLSLTRIRLMRGYMNPQRIVVFSGYVNIPSASVVNSVVRSYDWIDIESINPIFQAPACNPPAM